MEIKLYELFAPNLLGLATVKKFKRGSILLAKDTFGLILEGVVAVDKLHKGSEVDVSTLHLVPFGQLINVEKLFSTSEEERQYFCETKKAVIAVVSLKHFKKRFNKGSIEDQNIVSQELLSQYIKTNKDIEDTIVGTHQGTAYDKVLWALKRYQTSVNATEKSRILRDRLAIHTGVSPTTVTRMLIQLREEGVITFLSNTKAELIQD